LAALLYWQRFYAFATLHAALIVLVTAASFLDNWTRLLIAALSLALALLWVPIQYLSLIYVDRWKEYLQRAREDVDPKLLPEAVTHQNASELPPVAGPRGAGKSSLFSSGRAVGR
jgi:hypothetical protein